MSDMEKHLAHMIRVIVLKDEPRIWQELKLKKDTIIIVRPDHYIGLITDEGWKVAGDYLRRLAEPKKEEAVILPKIHT